MLTTALLALATTAVPVEEDYNQWKRALGTHAATAAEHITAPPGFVVELLRSASPDEGSWVAMTFDPQGRVLVAREDRGLLRLSAPPPGPSSSSWRVETINTNLLECRGLLFAHGALYVNANNSKGLHRLRSTQGDDRFDQIQLLQSTPGGVGHGRNQLALGPDGWIYSIHGDDVGLPTNGVAPRSAFRHYGEDRLLPCPWDQHLFNASARMPFGHLIRTDPEGRTWELVAGGLRNPFGIDFNEAGDLFTFDADMEWDVGLPWYHPTRVLHLVPGGDYGWRRGTGVLPVWSPDTLPSAVDVGLGSPTSVKFGTKSGFPEPFRQALYVLDWAYGKIHAVHLQRTGASYSGRTERFLEGRPLNVTGLDFGPDGAMYFVTGGRRTQSGLYRVHWRGPARNLATPAPAATPPLAPLWDRLNDSDRWVRHAARVELELQPADAWRAQALSESRPLAALTALLALARADTSAAQPRLIARLDALAATANGVEEQLLALRALGVCFIRMGRPDTGAVVAALARWEPQYPARDPRVNQSLCELLVYLGSTNAVRRTLPLLAAATAQEEKLQYLFLLSRASSGWGIAERRTYFDWLGRARREFVGGNALPTALNYIRAEAEAALTSAERTELASVLSALDRPVNTTPAPATQRPFVRDWTMADFASGLPPARARSPDSARGGKLFRDAGCATCHRLRSEGGLVGPDLTGVGGRFDSRALLESILEPSKVIADPYRNTAITTRKGVIVEGRVVSEDPGSVVLATNPVDPDARRRIARADIEAQRVSAISSMPEGLLNTFTRQEILDLLAWLAADHSAP